MSVPRKAVCTAASRLSVSLGNCSHAQIICQYQAAEPHAASQYSVQHDTREGSRILRIDLGQQDVRGHNQRHTRRDR